MKALSLASVAENYLVSRFGALTMPLFFYADVWFEEQIDVRGKPRAYLDVATRFALLAGGHQTMLVRE